MFWEEQMAPRCERKPPGGGFKVVEQLGRAVVLAFLIGPGSSFCDRPCFGNDQVGQSKEGMKLRGILG
jgi:hypothetical protein